MMRSLFSAIVLLTSIVCVSGPANANEAVQLQLEIQQRIASMSEIDRAELQARVNSLVQDLDEKKQMRKMSTEDDGYRVMACLQIHAGFLFSGQVIKCLNTDGQVVSMTILGIQFMAGVNGGVGVGFHKGPARSGTHGIEFGVGGHYFAGGEILSAGPYGLINGGVGFSGHFRWQGPSDSMFGGQLVVSVGRK